MKSEDFERYKSKLLMIMPHHVGRSNRISMADLYMQVFGEAFEDKINGTRELRTLITSLRDSGVPICSSASQSTGGYWLASAGSELTAYLGNIRSRALSILKRESALRKIPLPELLGQMSLELEKEAA